MSYDVDHIREEVLGEISLVPEGKWLAVIKGHELRTTKVKTTPYARIELSVKGPNGDKKAFSFCACLGSTGLLVDYALKKMVGVTVAVEVKHKMWNDHIYMDPKIISIEDTP